MAGSTVSLKLLIDTSAKRVLFAEAGKDCVDFLFHVLSLPVATIIRLLQDQGMGGSLPNLYKSLENLSDAYIMPDQNKDTFLKPAAPVSCSSVPLLALIKDEDDADAVDGKSFYRDGYSRSGYGYVSHKPCAVCTKGRRKTISRDVYVAPPTVQVASGGGGLVKGVVTYMVMDDLVVEPMSTISTITLLNKFNVKDVAALEEREVNLGIYEALKLLKASQQSKNVLTDVFY